MTALVIPNALEITVEGGEVVSTTKSLHVY